MERYEDAGVYDHALPMTSAVLLTPVVRNSVESWIGFVGRRYAYA